MTPYLAPGVLKMIESDWKKIKHFTKSEVAAACQRGLWQNIDAGSLYALDAFAGYAPEGTRLLPSVIFSPYKSGPRQIPTATWNTPDTKTHEPNSLHYAGRAFDLMFPSCSLHTAWVTALRFTVWGGVGLYPFWSTPGLHLDTRDAVGGQRVLWWVDKAGTYRYLRTEADIASMFTEGLAAHRLL